MSKPRVFTEQEITEMRAALDEFRDPGAYRAGQFMVSKFNRDPAVLGSPFPSTVVIRDITMRIVDQMPGVYLTTDDRCRLIAELAKAGIPELQLACFRREYDLEAMKREVAAAKTVNPDCKVVYGAATSADHLALAADAGVDAVQIWTAYLGRGAPSCAGAVYHRAWQGRDWRDLNFPKEPGDQVRRASDLISAGKEFGVQVAGTINLLPWASDEYIDQYSAGVQEAGCHEIDLADGPGGVGPEAFAHYVSRVRRAAPSCNVAVHAHDMFGLGCACSLASAKAGATILETAMNSYEPTAQADTAIVATALEALYGVSTGVDLSRMTPIARMFEQLTGYVLEWNHPVTGRSLFEESGSDEYVQELAVDPLIHYAFTPEFVGNQRTIGITRVTGPFTMWDKLTELGYDVNQQDVEAVLARCKSLMAQGRRKLTDDDLRTVANMVITVGATR